MARGQTITRKARGLFTNFNRLDAPEGSLLVADNCVINRPGVIEKRRGLKRYGQSLIGGVPASALLKFQRRLIPLAGTTLQRDSNGAGTWAAYSGSFSPPDATTRMESVEALQSFYFTTSLGPYKLDTLTGTPVRAGVPPGLDIQVALTGIGASWFPLDSQVGYRLIWVRVDGNAQEVLGEPTFRESIVNRKTLLLAWTAAGAGPYTVTVTHTAHGFATNDIVEIGDYVKTAGGGVVSFNGPQTITISGANAYTFSVAGDPGTAGTLSDGKKFDVVVTSTLPAGIVAGDYFELYRTPTQASSEVLDDRHLLVLRVQVTAADITAGFITFTDTKTNLGVDLYTNPLLETVDRANARPPWAKHVALFEGHVHYANTLQPHARVIQLINVFGLVDDTDTITIAGRTYTFSAAENQGANKFKRWTTESTLAENIRKTAQSLVKILNRDTGNTLVYARYESAPTADPGFIRVFARLLNGASFAFTVNVTATGARFSPLLPTSGTTISSSNDRKKNGLYWAKFEKPEAVPMLNFDPVGSADHDILGIYPLKDALLIHKQDGLFIRTGKTDNASGLSFVNERIDPTLILLVPATLAALDNAVWGWTTQGIIRATQASRRIMSWPIETDLNQLAQSAQLLALTHAVPYESDRALLAFSQERIADTKVKVAWRYNHVTEAWTRWRKNISCGIVLDLDTGGDRLYLGHGADPYILEERKGLQASDQDYIDETLDVSVTAVSTAVDAKGKTVTTVTLTYTYAGERLLPGFLFEQGTTEAIVKAVAPLTATSFLCTLDRQITATVAAATVSIPIRMHVEWMPETAGSAGMTKQFSQAQIYLSRDGGTHLVGFAADTQVGPDFAVEILVPRVLGWGASQWGVAPYGDAQPPPSNPISPIVHRDHQFCRALRIIYKNETAKENPQILQLTLSVGESSERTQREPR